MEVFSLVPDVNDTRAKRKGEWIFTEEPLEWNQEFPRLILQTSEFNVMENAGGMYDENSFVYYSEFDLHAKYFARRNTEYVCPDHFTRKGKGFMEYMLLHWVLPTFLQSKTSMIQKWCFIDTINVTNVSKIFEIEEYGLGFDITLHVIMKVKSDVPYNNDAYIDKILVDISGISGMSISGT
jgi:hypothetical protein